MRCRGGICEKFENIPAQEKESHMSASLLERTLSNFFKDKSLKHFTKFFLSKATRFKPLSEPFYELNGFQDYFFEGEKRGEIFYEQALVKFFVSEISGQFFGQHPVPKVPILFRSSDDSSHKLHFLR